MEDQDGWERLDQHLLTRLTQPGQADLHGLRLRDVCESVLNRVYRITL